MYKKILQLLSIVMLASNFVYAQQGGPDCSSAATICNSSSISINPSGIGFDDFSLPGNNAGCLSSDEQASTWFYFEFNANTPPNSPFTFTINPSIPVDYDFALFGPNVPDCDNLGSPLRCSYAALPGQTGLSTAANDLSEGAGGDRFVMEIFVNAGDGFFLLVDNFSQSNTSASISFGEAGAPFLDCLATPFCGLMADATATNQVCQDSGPFSLNSSVVGQTGGVTYNWTGAGGATAYLDDPTSPFPTVTLPPGFTGTLTYNLTVMDDACDMVTPDISIEVSPLPTIQIPDPGLICSTNDPIVLTANPGAGSGTWGGAAGPGGQIDPSLLGPGPHTVTYEYTDANGCTNDDFTDITITESPTAEILGDLELCQREIDEQTAVIDGYGLGGSPGYTYLWTTPQGTDNNQTVFVLEPGQYTLTVTDAAGCTGEAPGVVVDILPDPMITIFDPGAICGSSTSQEIFVGIFEDGVGEWDTSTGVINEVGFINPSDLGVGFHDVTYSFISNTTGCESTETLTFEISPPPTAIPSTGGPYCNGDDIELFGNASLNGATYSWTGPDGFVSNAQNPPTANGPGSYFLIVSIGGCESTPVELPISLDSSPVAMASNSGSACAGSAVTLQGSVNVSGTTIEYSWTGPDGYTSNQQNPTDAMVSGTYTLIVTVDGCSSDPQTTEVTIIDAPIATASNNGPACSGFVVGLAGNVNVSGTTITYAWTGPGGYTSNQQNPTDATMSGMYELIVTVDGCPSAPVPTNVVINDAPMAMATNSGSACEGTAVSLQGSVDVTGTNTIYSWTGPNGYTSNQQNPTDAMESGIYQLIVTVDGCPSNAVTTMVTIIDTPIATASNNGPSCSGIPVSLEGSVNVSGGTVTYDWIGPGGYTSNQQNPTDAMMSGTYELIVTVDGCPSALETTQVIIADAPIATASNNGPACAGSSVSLEGSVDVSGTMIEYSWTGPGGYTSNDQNPTDATETGTYQLIVTVDGCPSNPETTFVTIEDAPIAIAANNGPACAGDMVTLEGDVNVSGTMIEYSWTGPGGYTSNQQYPTDAILDGTYELIVTVDGCPSLPESTQLTILDTPIATASNNGPVCAGSNITLQGSIDLGGSATYFWTGPGGYTSNDQNPTDATMSGTYELTVIVDGCPSELELTQVTIVDAPIATASNNGPACTGSSVTLEGNVDVSGTTVEYSWTGPGGYTSSDQNPTDAMMSGMYELIVTVDGCVSAAVSTNVTIADAPIATASNNGPACAGSSVTLEGNVDVSGTTIEYSWTGPGGYTSSDQNPADAMMSGMYELIVTVDGCVSVAVPTNVTIAEEPIAIASNDGPVCSGSTIMLEGDVSISGTTIEYSWTGPNGYTSSDQNPTDVTESGDYNLIVTVDGCVSAAVPTQVTINPTPDAVPSNSGPYCADEAIVLSGNTTTNGTNISYEWAGPNGYNSTEQNPTDISIAGDYSLVVTVDGCISSAEMTSIEITPLPIAMPATGGNPCTAADIELVGGSDTPGVTYSWTGPDGFTSNVQNPPMANGPGIYTLVVENGNCSSVPVDIDINPGTAPIASASAAGPYCEGDVISLTGSVNATGSNIEYSWTGPNGYSSMDQNPTGITEGGIYELNVTVDGCVADADDVDIMITGLPTALPSTGGPYCNSADIELFGDASVPTATYSWVGPNGFVSSSQNPTTASEGGTYTLTVFENGCSSSSVDVTVVLNETPTADPANTGPYCAGDMIVLSGNTTTSGTVTEYSWTGPNGYISTDQNPVDATEPGAYNLTVTVDGCVSDVEGTTVEINELPIAQPATGGSPCTSTTIELLGNSNVAGIGETYAWTGPNGFTSNEQNPAMNGGEGSYELVVTLNGCSSLPVELIVDPGAEPVATASNGGPYCEGDLVDLAGSVNAVGMVVEYAWTGPNGYTSSDQNPTGATESGDYNLIVTVDGCVSNIAETTLVINEVPMAQATTGGSPCSAASIELLGSSSIMGMGETYAWTGPNGFISDEQNPMMNGGAGTYELVVTLNGCSSAPAELVVDPNAVPVATANNGGPFCAGDMINLTGMVDATGMVVEYSWTGPNGYISTDQNPTDATESGDYNLVATVDGCVSDLGTTTVVINDLPIAQPATGGSPCTSTTIELLGNSNVTGMGETYAWTGPNGFVSDEQNPTMNGGEGTYELVVTLNGCSSLPVELIVDPGAAPIATANNNGPFCADEIIALSGSVNASGMLVVYTWTGPNGYTSTAQNPTDATESGDYSLIATVDGCVSEEGLTTVVINDLPIAEPTTGGSPCTSTTIELLGSSNVVGMGETYSWTGPNGFVSNEQNPSMHGGAGTYFLTVIHNGCSSPPAELIVDPGAEPIATANNTGPYCIGDMIGLTGTVNAAGTIVEYAWTGPNGYTSSVQDPTDVTESGDYSLVVTVDGCVSNMAATTVEINTTPVAELTPNAIELCNTSAEGSTLDFGPLVISGDQGGTWIEQTSSGASGVFPNLDFDGVAAGTYIFTYTTNSAVTPCVDQSYDISIVVEECACPGVNLNTPSPLCNVDGSLDLSTLVNSGPDGFWTILTSPGGANPAMLTNTTLDATNADQGMYTLQYTLIDAVPNGCETEFTVDLSVSSATTAGVANAPLDFCSDESNMIDLFGELTGADAGGMWSILQGGGAGFDAGSGSFVVNGQPSDTYIFQYELLANGACPGDIETVTVNINELPVAEAGAGTTLVCGMNDYVLTGSGTTGNGIEISWSGPGMIVNGDSYTPTINSEGVYTLTVENTLTGCISTDEVEIFQSADIPVVNVSTANPLTCDSLSVVLFANTDLLTPVDYSWIGPNGFSSNEQYPSVNTGGDYFVTIFNPANNCTSSPVLVAVADNSESPNIDLIVPLEPLDCDTEDILVDASGSQGNGELSFTFTNSDNEVISTASSFEISIPGTYELLVVNTTTGCSAVEIFTIEQDLTEPIPSISTPGTIDCNNPSVIVTGTSQSSGSNPIYNWYDANGNLLTSDNENLTATLAGVYSLEVVNGDNQCRATTEVTVSADLEVPMVSIEEPEMLDCTVTEITLSGAGSASGSNIAYEWQNEIGEIIGTEITVPVTSIGDYELIVTNTENGCTSLEEVEVDQNGDDIDTALIISEPSDCFESDNGLIIVSEIEGGTAPFVYRIGGESFTSQNAYFNLSPGVYEVQVSDALGCEWETEVTVTEPDPLSLTIDLNLAADASLFYGDSLILNATTLVPTNQIDTLMWDQSDLIRCEDEDCFEGVVNGLFDPTTFSATLIDTAGCTVTASVSVGVEKVREIYIPNSFSPNGDGTNDIFFINGGRGISQINSFRVYNRWGEVVYSDINFQPNDPTRGWNGMFRGKEVNPAVFVYVAEILFIDGFEEMYSGDVTVVK